MKSVLEQQLLVITGKGGVGKTTVAAAAGLLAAQRGLRTIVVEVGEQARLPELFEATDAGVGIEGQLQEQLWGISIDPDRALMEWLQSLGGRVSGRVLASSNTFQYFAAAAPGAKELVSMVKIWELTQKKRWRGRPAGYDLVVLDAPATGHAVGMLDSPRTFGSIARVGPIATQTERVAELLGDPARTSYLAVSHPSEMAVTETLELQGQLQRQLSRSLHAVVANGVLPLRFNAAELQRLGQLNTSRNGIAAAAVNAAHAAHNRARLQRNQLARLRRRQLDVLTVPFQFEPALDLPAIRRIAAHLRRRL